MDFDDLDWGARVCARVRPGSAASGLLGVDGPVRYRVT